MPELTVGVMGIAFVGGVLMFLAPCTLPLIPAFLASLVHSKKGNDASYARTLTKKTILFSVGFTAVFVTFGLLTGFFGSIFSSFKQIISQIGGGVVIIFGLSLMGAFSIPMLRNATSRMTPIFFESTHAMTPLILGALFALGWSPCAGPVLASILLLASGSDTILQGGLLLAIFSLGLAIPFILVGLFYAHTTAMFRIYERYQKSIARVSGALLIAFGVFIVLGRSVAMTEWGFALYSFFGYVPMCAYF